MKVSRILKRMYIASLSISVVSVLKGICLKKKKKKRKNKPNENKKEKIILYIILANFNNIVLKGNCCFSLLPYCSCKRRMSAVRGESFEVVKLFLACRCNKVFYCKSFSFSRIVTV